MWGRKKRKQEAEQAEQAESLQPEQSYWATHEDPLGRPAGTVIASTSGATPIKTVITVNGKQVDMDSDAAQHVMSTLAKRGHNRIITQTHVTETTSKATPEQEKQIAALLERHASGELSDQDFGAAIMQVMNP